MQFRTAIRALPPSVVEEFLRMPEDLELRRLLNYGKYIHLILFHQLPHSEEEEEEARAELHRAWNEWEQKMAERREAAHQRRLARLAEKRRIATQKHRQRQAESARRKELYFQIAAKPMLERVVALLTHMKLPPGFFSIRPEEVNDCVLAQIDADSRSALAERIRHMRQESWRDLRMRLLRDSARLTK